jgi:multiple sugar transport system permease protein
MIGKSMLEFRFGPVTICCASSLENRRALTTPWLASPPSLMDACGFVHDDPHSRRAAGLSKKQEAAKVDGATGWQGFWEITFPLMLPVSVYGRSADHLQLSWRIVINTTSGRAAPPTRSRAISSASTRTARMWATVR